MDPVIVQQIEQVLALEDIDAPTLTRELFWVGGLFQRLAPTEQERKAVSQTALYRRAMARYRELADREVVELEAARKHRQAARSQGTNGQGNGAVAQSPGSSAPESTPHPS